MSSYQYRKDEKGTKATMHMRLLGQTGLRVSALGLGGHELNTISDETATLLIHRALERGVNVIDTAECYGQSEERIGRILGGRRKDCYLFTKCGHTSGLDQPDWSPRLLELSIERSLRRLRTDAIDGVLLHSCSLEILQRGEVIATLQRARDAGKVRFLGYSGDRAPARFAATCGAFDILQLSVNIADQEAIEHIIPLATERKMGVIAKRPLANLAWRRASLPADDPALVYQERLQVLRYDFLRRTDEEAIDTALRFTASIPGLHIAIVGTTNPNRIEDNLASLTKGPLPQAQFEAIRARWQAVTWWRRPLLGGRLGWHGLI